MMRRFVNWRGAGVNARIPVAPVHCWRLVETLCIIAGMTDKTREQLIDELRASQQVVQGLLAEMVAVQDWQREPAEWSFRDMAAHLAEVERACHAPRIAAIATGEQPHFSRYSATGADFARYDLAESLAAWAAERRKLLDFVAALPNKKLLYTGVYPIVGEVTLLDALDDLHAQDQGHIRHIHQLIVDYREDN